MIHYISKSTSSPIGVWFSAILLAVIVANQPAYSDSWAPPQHKTYLSSDKKSRFTIIPRGLKSSLEFFEEKVAGIEAAGQDKKGNKKARGILERINSDGKWSVVWAEPLINDVSPVSAIVTNSGNYVVTFDNWHFMGHGSDAIVIYDETGQVVRALALTDVLPKTYVSSLPHSVSSISWSGEHLFDESEEKLNLKVAIPANRTSREKREFLDVLIDLKTGIPLPLEGPKWERAKAASDESFSQQKKNEIASYQFFTEPLLGPTTNGDREWHQYLSEAFYRLNPEGTEDSTSTKVLRLPVAENYQPSEEWIREALLEKYADNVAIASHSPENLVLVLNKIVNSLRKNRLKKLRIYIAARNDVWPNIEQIFAKSGATVIQLNPDEPIPQRPDRLARFRENSPLQN